jgi:hypothetical protein
LAVEYGHHHVEYDGIRVTFQCLPDGRAAVCCYDDVVAARSKPMREEFYQQLVIVAYQYRLHRWQRLHFSPYLNTVARDALHRCRGVIAPIGRIIATVGLTVRRYCLQLGLFGYARD